MATLELDITKEQSSRLLPRQKLELIEFLSNSLSPKANGQGSKMLEFGKYKNSGLKKSGDDDFKIAEWHPTDAEMNGD